MHTLRPTIVFTGLLLALVACGCQSADKPADPKTDQTSLRMIETRANTFTYNRQTNPALDADANGNLLLVWGSRRQEQGTYGVFAQRYDALGRRLGRELHVNQTVRSMQHDPAVAYDGNQTAWIAWQSDQQDGQQGTIVARRFGLDASGQFGPLCSEIVVNQTATGHQAGPSVAANQAGQALIAWTSDHDGRIVLMGRLYASDGKPAGDEFCLGTAAAVFALVQALFVGVDLMLGPDDHLGVGLITAWSGYFYESRLLDNLARWGLESVVATKNWFHYAAIIDAALTGMAMAVGLSAGLIAADTWYQRWEKLVNQVGE